MFRKILHLINNEHIIHALFRSKTPVIAPTHLWSFKLPISILKNNVSQTNASCTSSET